MNGVLGINTSINVQNNLAYRQITIHIKYMASKFVSHHFSYIYYYRWDERRAFYVQSTVLVSRQVCILFTDNMLRPGGHCVIYW